MTTNEQKIRDALNLVRHARWNLLHRKYSTAQRVLGQVEEALAAMDEWVSVEESKRNTLLEEDDER